VGKKGCYRLLTLSDKDKQLGYWFALQVVGPFGIDDKLRAHFRYRGQHDSCLKDN